MINIGVTTGWLVTFWVGGIFALGLAISLVFLFRPSTRRSPRYDRESAEIASFIFGLITAGILVVSAIVWFILPSETRVNYTINGTILESTNSFDNGTGDITNEGYAFRVDTTEDVLWTADARLQQMAGRNVNLICTREWVIRATDIWKCSLNDELVSN